MTRIELMTTRLSGVCSTTELHALYISNNWNGWARTNAYSYQKQMPYHLATFHLSSFILVNIKLAFFKSLI
jgi:hypothetical protein